MSATWTCPDCRLSISSEDVNPSTDVALCRACGRTHSFADLAEDAELGPVDPHDLPRGVRIVPDPMADLRVVHQRRSPIAFVLVPFTLVWAGGSMSAIYGSQIAKGSFDPMISLFGIPFLLGSVVLVAITLMSLLGRTEIALHRGEGTVFVGVGSLGRVRHFRYDRDTRVRITPTSAGTGNVPQEQITLSGSDGDLSFGAMLVRPEARRAIAALVREEVRRS